MILLTQFSRSDSYRSAMQKLFEAVACFVNECLRPLISSEISCRFFRMTADLTLSYQLCPSCSTKSLLDS